MSEAMAAQYPTKPSAGSQVGQACAAANGTTMANKEKHEVRFRTSEGHDYMLKMQVADVQRPAISISRICDE